MERILDSNKNTFYHDVKYMYDSCEMNTGNSLRVQMLSFDYMFFIALDGQYVFRAFRLQFQSCMLSEVKYIFVYKL